MSPENIAMRFARRPGYKLVSYAEVVLPVYRLTLEVITLDHKRIPPIEEFILKSVNAGLQTIKEISSLLGIKESVISGGLINLLRSEDISVASVSGQQKFWLSQKGKETLLHASIITPQEHTIQIYFDALLRKPVPYYKERFYSPRQIGDLAYYDIPFFPPNKPQLSDLSRHEVEKVIQQGGRLKDYKTELIAVKRIEKTLRVGRYAIALVYRSSQTNEINVAFVIDGVQSKEIESAFAYQDGPRMMHLDRYYKDFDASELLKRIPEELVKQMPTPEELERLEESEANAQLNVETITLEVERAITPKSKREAQDRLVGAMQELERVQADMDRTPIRYLSIYESPRIFKKALDESKERLMIMASRITLSVVSAELIILLEATLQKGVNLYIAYALGHKGIGQRDSDLRQAEERLKNLANKHPNFKLKRLDRVEEPLLLYDTQCVVLGKFNWLAYKGNPDRLFEAEQGLMITKREYIDEKFKEKLDYFMDE